MLKKNKPKNVSVVSRTYCRKAYVVLLKIKIINELQNIIEVGGNGQAPKASAVLRDGLCKWGYDLPATPRPCFY